MRPKVHWSFTPSPVLARTMATKNIGLDMANFVALWVETALWGFYTLLFVACIYVLLAPNSRRPDLTVNKPLLVTAIVMYALSTISVTINFAKNIHAFVLGQTTVKGALKYFAQVGLPLNVAKQAVFVTNNMVADGLLIYRCFVIWNNSYLVIALPAMMLIGTSVCGYLAVYGFTRAGDNVFTPLIVRYAAALFIMSLITNITVSSLIAGRVWWISRASAILHVHDEGRKLRYNRAIAIALESAAIYSVCNIIFLVLYFSKHNALTILYDSMHEIVGIVPTLIIVRVGLGMSVTNRTPTGILSTTGGGQSETRTAGGTSRSQNATRGPSYGQVRVERTVYTTGREAGWEMDDYGTNDSLDQKAAAV